MFRVSADRLKIARSGRGWEITSFRAGEMFDALSLRGDIAPNVSSSAVLVAKSEAALELRAPGPPLLHVGYEGGMLGEGIQYALSFSDAMCIDMLVIPGDDQVAWADILSNHGPDFHGMAIEQRGDQTNHFSVTLGSGKTWMDAGEFALEPGHRSYVSLQIRGQETALYVNGHLVASKVLPDPLASSSRPFFVGNWIGGGRPFNGLVEELLISEGNRGGEQVLADSNRLLGRERQALRGASKISFLIGKALATS